MDLLLNTLRQRHEEGRECRSFFSVFQQYCESTCGTDEHMIPEAQRNHFQDFSRGCSNILRDFVSGRNGRSKIKLQLRRQEAECMGWLPRQRFQAKTLNFHWVLGVYLHDNGARRHWHLWKNGCQDGTFWKCLGSPGKFSEMKNTFSCETLSWAKILALKLSSTKSSRMTRILTHWIDSAFRILKSPWTHNFRSILLIMFKTTEIFT